jgi:hypothetical protein
MLRVVLDNKAQGDPLEEFMEQQIPTTTVYNSISVEISPGRFLNINANLNEQQQQKLIQILSKYQQAFAWEYPNMKGIVLEKTRLRSNKIKTNAETKHRRHTIQERHRFTWFTQCGLRPPEKLSGPSFIIIQQMKGYNLQQNPL